MEFSKTGLIVALSYIFVCVVLVWSDLYLGYFGGGGGTLLTVTMPWILLIAASGINEIVMDSEIMFWLFFVTVPVLLNSVIFYWIASRIEKL